MGESGSTTKSDVFVSLLTLSVVFLFTSSMMFSLVSDKLITTQLTSNPRYAVTFPALDYIEGHDDAAVVAIGSSIIQAAVNGNCIMSELDTSSTSVYNLGISGANPYTETLQIPALVRANPELVLLDLGPNGLWDYYDDEDLNEYVQFRFTINSISMNQDDVGGWADFIREIDRQWVAFTYEERMKLAQSYSQQSMDDLFRKVASKMIDEVDHSERAPLPSDPDWHRYLTEPYFSQPFFEKKSDDEISTYLAEKMPKKAKQGVYNPKVEGTLNHIAYEYIIEELRAAGIPVLLIATPHHPGVYSYLEEGQLHGFNETFSRFANLSGVHGINMFWEEWHSSMFRDRNHLGENGRAYFCERISPHIDTMLEDGFLEQNILQSQDVNLSNFLEETCEGTGHTTVINNQLEFVQAEAFSDCSYGEGIAFSDTWEFRSSGTNKGSGFLQALPEDVSQYKTTIRGSRLDYNFTFVEPGEYHVWLRMRGNSYGNDTVGLMWDHQNEFPTEFEKYSSFGWTTDGHWEWEPEFNRAPLSINISGGETHKLSLFMMEDGVEIDEILITSLSTLNPKKTDPYSIEKQPLSCKGSGSVFDIEAQGEHLLEAEDYTSCLFGEGPSIAHQWELFGEANASGGNYVQALPDSLVHMRYEEKGPSLLYELDFESTGTYFVWLLMRGNSYGNDTVGLVWNGGNTSSELIISSYAWDSKGQWEWEPKTSRLPLQINVTKAGNSELLLLMREDGVQIDAILVTDDPLFDPIKEW